MGVKDFVSLLHIDSDIFCANPASRQFSGPVGLAGDKRVIFALPGARNERRGIRVNY